MTDNKTLVCVIAETRAFKTTWHSFKKNVLDELNADLALCISTPDNYNYDNPFWKEAKYKWTVPEYDDWGKAFDYAQSEIMSRDGITEKIDWRKMLLVKDQWLGGIEGEHKHPGSAAILIYFRWHLLQKLIHEGLIDQYDRFIITRSDFVWENSHPKLELLDASKIWVPDGEAYFGVTDRHVVLSKDSLVSYLGIIEPILVQTDHLFSVMHSHKEWNLEQFIHFILKAQGLTKIIYYFPYCMYSIREREGTTRWQKGIWSEELGYFIKYQNEYHSAKSVQQMLKVARGWFDILDPKSDFKFNSIVQYKDSFFSLDKSSNGEMLIKLTTQSEIILNSEYVLHIDCYAQEGSTFIGRFGLGHFERSFLENIILEKISQDIYYIKSASRHLYYAVSSEGLLHLNAIPSEFVINNRNYGYPRLND
jgi:hypothetical protein